LPVNSTIPVKISRIKIHFTKRIGKKISKASDDELPLSIEGWNEIIGG